MVTTERMAKDPAREDLLVLVDGLDREIGTATKERAHSEGLLHRAFSVVLVREGADGLETLISQRAEGKYHSAGLWANSCCSHPRAGEELLDAARRRAREELGCEVSDLHEVSAFAYRAEFDDGLSEYEFDHVIVARSEGELSPDPSEVSDVRWVSFDELAKDLAAHPRKFSAWAPMALSLAMSSFR